MIASKEQVDENVNELLCYGVDKVFVYQDEIYEDFNIDRAHKCVKDFVETIKPSVILYGGTSLGRSFAPKIAAEFKTGLTADCTFLDIKENSDLIQVRPAFGGNVMAQIICSNTRPQMSTVRYKNFKKPEKVTPHGEVVYCDVDHINKDSVVKILSQVKKELAEDISEADIIVACGRAFKEEKDMAIAKELADLLGGVVACSRPLCEAGLTSTRQQIGLSGKMVSPKLIFVLGISGAIQFTSGMQNSDLIIAINNDPDAQIFDYAHYGIVGDVFKVVPELIKAIKKERGE
jgi:electron transfer flavoprotein alpha subunit